MAKLSVIIPTFKRPFLLQKAIKSVLQQDFKDLELIISDDNSNDETKQKVLELQKEDSRIRYVVNTRYKQGPNGNKNNGLDYANAEFISFLDDDDELLPGALSTLLKKVDEGYEHCFGNCLLERNNILSNELSGKGLHSDSEITKKDFLMGRFYGEFFSVFKKSLLANARFNDELYGNEATLWVHLYKKKSFYIHKALRVYRFHQSDSVTLAAVKNAKRVYLGYLQMAKLLEDELQNDQAYAQECAKNYKMAAYYAKFAKEYKGLYHCLFKSLRIHCNLPALLLLILSIMPSKMIVFLSRIRVALCKN
ncbi:glycosyltransferase family 2 protein [Campylobacter sp. MIT 21-1685]|uniref:GalNAc(5)-diNAcBac-PP-undecaprenol beta-1,3-glucosyltransferase n=1 Tax=unclassified Campylobacter TaxID=2593542 RepID=UPI00224B915F|nr:MULTISPECIES: glycosyltransferase family 2 protein [unclassified Campylobacter]MCX2683205.1 glycosyltransferase family 2 protein [Campylobacter sp. MIT 21-1684]MCX2751475.1 glycosyltransferase family 2 protein [Campylobacter sp. MIT 21-1682]MCX2807686.1 glycosyltransferase family 2 protein [Campylobacter sp. MIT 21-1685]